MNKYLNMILCAALALLLVGCVTVKEPVQTTEATLETTEATTAPTEESIPGVEENPFENPIWDEEHDDNTESNSGNDAEDNPGSNNTEKPQETQPSQEETQPSQGETQPGEEEKQPAPAETSYESYNAMSGEAQLAFFNTFATPEDFFAWYNQAKAEYEAAHPDIEVGDGKVDMEDIIGGGN